MRFDTSMDSLNVTRSESVTDLNTEINGLPLPRRASIGHVRNDENLIPAPPKPFGIGKHIYIFSYLDKMFKIVPIRYTDRELLYYK